MGGDGCVGDGAVREALISKYCSFFNNALFTYASLTTDSRFFILFSTVEGRSDHHHYASDKSIKKLFVEARVQAKGDHWW